MQNVDKKTILKNVLDSCASVYFYFNLDERHLDMPMVPKGQEIVNGKAEIAWIVSCFFQASTR